MLIPVVVGSKRNLGLGIFELGFFFVRVEGESNYFFEIRITPVSGKKFKEPLIGVETQTNVVALKINEETLDTLEEFVFYFEILPNAIFEVRVLSLKKRVLNSVKR